MTDEEVVEALRMEYWGWQEARRRQIENVGIATDEDLTFYEWLQNAGFSYQKLSRMGIAKEPQP
jgi:transposase